MKTAILAVAMVLSASAFASNVIDARTMTCGEFKNILNTEKVIQVAGYWGVETHHARIPNCELGWKYKWTQVSTQDVRYCAAGYVCEPDYSGGGRK